MKLNMEYIYQIYQEGSLTEAAEKLHLTQPALSLAVRQEEKSIGSALFDRSQRPWTLTIAGEAYIRAAEQIMWLESDLTRELKDLRDLNTGKIHIGGSHYINCFFLAEILADFSKKYPGIQLQISEDSSARLSKRLERRELDMTFSCAPEQINRFKHQPAFSDHILLAVPEQTVLSHTIRQSALSATDIQQRRHLSQDCPRVSLREFQDIEFILLQKGNNLHDRSLAMFEEAGFQPKVKMTLSQLVTAHRFAEQGLGATFISDRIIFTTPGRLMYFSIASQYAHRLFYTLLAQRTYTDHAVHAFITYMREWLLEKESENLP
ncbi:MAG: LysR family transcriptional regulator [Enterocloster citroniae]|nr:LysR family transcriptional regulator [Enterocloster citroniae]